jgi:DNA-binding NtrC family response regulator
VAPETGQLETTQLPDLFWEKFNEDISSPGHLANDNMSLKEKLRCYENQLIMQALRESHGNITKAALLLKTSRQNLHTKCNR